MIDIGDGLGARERGQVEAQSHALHELNQFPGIELLVELGLSREDDAQHLLLGRLDAREHANFLEHLVAQVLRLVDDQHDLASGDVLLGEKLVEGRQHLGLFHVERREAELHEHGLQECRGGELRLIDLRDHDFRLELAQERLDQGGLARTDLARDHHEAIGEPDGRLHVRLGACMLLAEIQELRVRTQAEGELMQFEQF